MSEDNNTSSDSSQDKSRGNRSASDFTAAKYRDLIEGSSDFIYVLNREGCFIFANSEVEHLLGYTPEEIIGKHYSDVIHDEDVPSVGHSFAERRTGERATDRLEVRLRSRSGAMRDVEMDIRQFSLSSSGMYQDSQFIGTHGVVRDITTRKYNESKKQALNDLDRAIWGMARVDDIHIILEGIRSAMQTVELPFSEFGVSVIDMADPPTVQFYSTYQSDTVERKAQWMAGDAQNNAEAIIETWQHGQIVHTESITQDLEGKEAEALRTLYGPIESVVHVPFSHGVLTIATHETHFSTQDLDFVEELSAALSDGYRRVEDLIDLTLSEQRYRRIVETPNLLIFLLDTTGNFIYVSPQIKPRLGYSPQDFYGDPRHFLRIVHDEDREVATKLLTSHAPQDSVEYRWLDQSGTYRWSSASSFSIYDSEGNRAINRRSLVQIVVQDVDDRKLAEDKIKSSLAEKEVLLKEIHHRVKNNLQVISSLLDLQSRSLPEDMSNVFEDSQHRITSMALIHEELYKSTDLASIDFAAYANNLMTHLMQTYSPVGVKKEIVVDAQPLTLDRAIPMGLIVNELASNALKYAFPDRRSGTITISLTSQSQSDFVLSVSDDGVGFKGDIDPKTLKSLGLKLVYTLAMQLQGRVELSKENGTMFSVVRKAPQTVE